MGSWNGGWVASAREAWRVWEGKHLLHLPLLRVDGLLNLSLGLGRLQLGRVLALLHATV